MLTVGEDCSQGIAGPDANVCTSAGGGRGEKGRERKEP